MTDVGMTGCGALDVAALNDLGLPGGAKVIPASDMSAATFEDPLEGINKE